MADPESTEPKIIVDTDWKEQVAREKEAAMKSPSTATDGSEKPEAQAPGEVASPAAEAVASAGDDRPPLPPASFETLVSMLFTQAMATLGQFPDPTTGKPEVDKTYAKHYIDTLDLLRDKTQGNLSENESKLLSEALHALRMTFVQVRATR